MASNRHLTSDTIQQNAIRDMFIAMRRAKSLDRFNSSRPLIPRNDEAGSALEQHFNWANEVHEYRP